MHPSEPSPKPVDLWVKRNLGEQYGSVLREQLPQEWLALLDPKNARRPD